MSQRWGRKTWNGLVVSDRFAAAHQRTVERSVNIIAKLDTKHVSHDKFFELSPAASCAILRAVNRDCDEDSKMYLKEALQYDTWIDYETQRTGLYLGEAVPGECAKEYIGEYPTNGGPCNRQTAPGSAYSTWATAEFAYQIKSFAYLPSLKYYTSLVDVRYLANVGTAADPFPDITAESLVADAEDTRSRSSVSDPSTNHCSGVVRLRASGETFRDHDGGGFHADGVTCVWQISETFPVLLSEIDIKIEVDSDNVFIYEGLCAAVAECEGAFPLLARFSGGKGTGPSTVANDINPRPPVLSMSGAVTVIFAADGISDRPLRVVVDDGMSMKWTRKPWQASCGGVDCQNGGSCVSGFCHCKEGYDGADCSSRTCMGTKYLVATSDAQIITNGVEGEPTAHNADCRWIVQAQRPEEVVAVEVVRLDLDWLHDHLEFHEGATLRDKPLKKSGYFTPKLNTSVGDGCPGQSCFGLVVSAGQHLTVRWSSDAMDSGKGFQLRYRSVPAATAKCGLGSHRDCSGHGVCGQDGCFCEQGWFGHFCQLPQCVGKVTIPGISKGQLSNMGAAQLNYGPEMACEWELLPGKQVHPRHPADAPVPPGAIVFTFIAFDLENSRDLASHGDRLILRGMATDDHTRLPMLDDPTSEIVFDAERPPCLERGLAQACNASEDCGPLQFCGAGICHCPRYIITGSRAEVLFVTDKNNYPLPDKRKGFQMAYEAIYDCAVRPDDPTNRCVPPDLCQELGMVMAPFGPRFCECPPGDWENEPHRCTPCEVGHYCPGSGHRLACPAGATAPRGKKALTDCMCEPGYNRSSSEDVEDDFLFFGDLVSIISHLDTASVAYGNHSDSRDPDLDYCMLCPAGTFSSDMHSEACGVCDAGRASAAGSPKCEICSPGHYAREGAASCDTCLLFHFACSGAATCAFDAQFIVQLVLCFVLQFFVVYPVAFNCRRGMRILDVTQLGDKVVVTTLRSHKVRKRRWGAKHPPVCKISGAKHPLVDDARFRVKSLEPNRLELRHLNGDSILDSIESSMGVVTLCAPHDFVGTGNPVPTALGFILLMPLPWAAGAMPLRNSECLSDEVARHDGLLVMWTVFSATVLATLLARLKIRKQMMEISPLQRRIKRFRSQVLENNPKPQSCERGPDRAVALHQIISVYSAFSDLIRERNAYYLDANIIKPLTKPRQLSFAELVGPRPLQYYCSHYWGTPFPHFVETVRLHAQDVGGLDWGSISYWICFLSNNQWHVSEEVGKGDWRDSSFFKAMSCGDCRATVMVVDHEALPLTRSWCIFEVLQTYLMLRNKAEKPNFEGLVFCTERGVIGRSDLCFDIAVTLARRVATLRLQNASASSQDDDRMIKELVRTEGGMSTMNRFVRENMLSTLTGVQRNFTSDMQELREELQRTSSVRNLEEFRVVLERACTTSLQDFTLEQLAEGTAADVTAAAEINEDISERRMEEEQLKRMSKSGSLSDDFLVKARSSGNVGNRMLFDKADAMSPISEASPGGGSTSEALSSDTLRGPGEQLAVEAVAPEEVPECTLDIRPASPSKTVSSFRLFTL
eukprot:TRINITY_DN18178_c0_g1_i1.p1 TRINITY_DN18178_c0_g1~~TRINITY_DN18178_c0_g1_i1.p1  ORF type:complete len:1787 (+),score=298.65 TRINITY_DN18178_c0_g1_i1:712-5361(+)